MKLVSAITLIVLLAGCKSFKLTRVEDRQAGSPLDAGGIAFVAVTTSDQARGDAADEVAMSVRNVLAPEFEKFINVAQANQPQTGEEALAAAQAAGASYLVLSEILHWEERADTFAHSYPDQIRVRVSVLDAKSGAVVDSAEVFGRSDMWIGAGDGISLFRSGLRRYLSELFPQT